MTEKTNELTFYLIFRHEPPVTSLQIDILHQDEDLIVVNKPSSIPVNFFCFCFGLRINFKKFHYSWYKFSVTNHFFSGVHVPKTCLWRNDSSFSGASLRTLPTQYDCCFTWPWIWIMESPQYDLIEYTHTFAWYFRTSRCVYVHTSIQWKFFCSN